MYVNTHGEGKGSKARMQITRKEINKNIKFIIAAMNIY